ncbi:glycoside hydrolase family 13 protein [Clostridium tarantellae]|uniref:Glycoside hydrolase family 13 protein n=1 Tax=Clostridium tarantellae TaxID=39493 RepID=A0A6I1MIW3_9CLOT|nr:glycoside hydrolase family 13 protein [Clostridium tarantellae]MPQ43315.1 glycoside hydrolase family 13 protein [Clostridium tarantellae]
MDKGYVFHNSQHCNYRKPFGAVTINQEVILFLEVKGDQCKAFVEVIRFDGKTENISMKCCDNSYECNSKLFKAIIEVKNQVGLIKYYFRIEKNNSVLFYGNNDDLLGGIGRIYYENPKAYQITVYEDFNVPKWYKEGIIYQIFVDRFFNGNEDGKIINPKPNSFIYGNWYDDPMYIKDTNGNISRWDFFGGNLKGVRKKLKYLKDLGVSIIYMNPIFKAVSCHKYDIADYELIDEMFGTNEEFKLLCEEAKKLNIRIILDGVFSHTGADSKYFNKYGNYESLGAYESRCSPYFQWYRFFQYPDKYECWWGFDNQPNVEELTPSYIDFIIKNENSIIAKWIKLGASGWRLDVADELPDEFIMLIKERMKLVDNESVLIGEVWEDASNKISYSQPRKYFFGKELDSVTNYPLREIILSFVQGYIDSVTFAKKIMNLKENYPKENFFSCMNLLGNHDTERVLTRLNNRMELLKLAICMQMTLPGVPLVYYGDEAGSKGSKDPDNRKTFPWGKENIEVLKLYKTLINIRTENEIFTKGDFNININYDLPKEVLVYKRDYNKKEGIVLINSSNENKKVTIDISNGKYKDIINNNFEYFIGEQGLFLNLIPYACKILIEN